MNNNHCSKEGHPNRPWEEIIQSLSCIILVNQSTNILIDNALSKVGLYVWQWEKRRGGIKENLGN